MSGHLLLEIQQGATHAHISLIYRYIFHSQSIVSCAFAASTTIFLSALITGIIVLSIKGTCWKPSKERRGGGSLRITTLKHSLKMFNDAYFKWTVIICYSCILPKDVLSGSVLWSRLLFGSHWTKVTDARKTCVDHRLWAIPTLSLVYLIFSAFQKKRIFCNFCVYCS